MAKKTKPNYCSLDDELMMACAYRYAIGRHTYVNSLANHIAKEYYTRLSPERLEFTANDIRKHITDCLQWGPCHLSYDGTVNYDERDGFNDLMLWMQENVKSVEDLDGIEKIKVYKESYSANAPKKYQIYKAEPQINHHRSEMDIDDLIIWYTLSCVFDKKRYKIVHAKHDNIEDDIIAVQTWHRVSKEIPNEPGYYRMVQWQWEPCWKSVNDFVSNGDYCGYIPNEFIESISDYSE